jgi:hypothetical protein
MWCFYTRCVRKRTIVAGAARSRLQPLICACVHSDIQAHPATKYWCDPSSRLFAHREILSNTVYLPMSPSNTMYLRMSHLEGIACEYGCSSLSKKHQRRLTFSYGCNFTAQNYLMQSDNTETCMLSCCCSACGKVQGDVNDALAMELD